MKVHFFECQVFAAAAADCDRGAEACQRHVVEAEASVYAVSSGRLGAVVAAMVALSGLLRAGLARCCTG